VGEPTYTASLNASDRDKRWGKRLPDSPETVRPQLIILPAAERSSPPPCAGWA
jgi:hypothetical protein